MRAGIFPVAEVEGEAPVDAERELITQPSAEEMSQSTRRKTGRKRVILIAAAVLAVIVIAVVAGVLVLSGSPARRLAQQLDLGNRYLSEMEYEQAIAAYEQALAIDPKSAEAYAGLIGAYGESGDIDGVLGAYADATAHLSGEELEKVLRGTLQALADTIGALVQTQEIANYRKALAYFEKMIEIAGENAAGFIDSSHLSNCLEALTAQLLAEGYTEGARELLAKWQTYLPEAVYIVLLGQIIERERVAQIVIAANAAVGDIVTFGAYEQDGNTANGAEPVEWVVLDTDEYGVLLLSRYVLDVQPYNTERANVTWESCTLRDWLNNTFFDTVFIPEEKAAIRETEVINSGNPVYGTPGGNDTQDRLFCLSIDEVRQYYTFTSWYDEDQSGFSEQLLTEATPYAIEKGVAVLTISENDYDNGSDYNWADGSGRTENGKNLWGGLIKENFSRACIGRTCCPWGLRSPSWPEAACYVSSTGGLVVSRAISFVDSDNLGVRPALWLDR